MPLLLGMFLNKMDGDRFQAPAAVTRDLARMPTCVMLLQDPCSPLQNFKWNLILTLSVDFC